jgi:cell division protein FtsB
MTLLVVGAAALAVFVGIGFARETIRARQIDGEISALREESERLRARTLEIRSLKTALGKEEFLEREARTKLNLQKEGERVVIVRRDGAAPEADARPLEQEAWTNPKKWWTYFTDRPTYDAYVADTHD